MGSVLGISPGVCRGLPYDAPCFILKRRFAVDAGTQRTALGNFSQPVDFAAQTAHLGRKRCLLPREQTSLDPSIFSRRFV